MWYFSIGLCYVNDTVLLPNKTKTAAGQLDECYHSDTVLLKVNVLFCMNSHVPNLKIT